MVSFNRFRSVGLATAQLRNSRFNSPSQLSMDLAAKLLKDQDYVARFLEKSQNLLSQARSLAEELLTEAGIQFHQKG